MSVRLVDILAIRVRWLWRGVVTEGFLDLYLQLFYHILCYFY